MRYTDSHEWISLEGDVGTVGITSYAQKELGEIVYIELPQIGKMIQAGEEVCVLESTKAAVDVYSPVSGKVVDVNESLKTVPSSLDSNSAENGWLFRLEIAQPSEYDRLLSFSQYQASIEHS